MTIDADRTRPVSTRSSPASDDEARAFLQERLAYLGKVYASIGLSFYVIGNVVDLAAGDGFLTRRLTDGYTWIVPSACAMYLLQWAVCRNGARRLSTLRLIDATTAILTGAFHSGMMFSSIPGELPGLSYARALLLFTFGMLIRAVLIPSSPQRTLILGVLAGCAPVLASHVWYITQPGSAVSPGMHAFWTTEWCLGSIVVATLASHVIFGLRKQVREAWQLGQYTLLEKIGEGGMGAVYRASHAMLRRPTAVKLLAADKAGAERLERFEREVQLTSQLTHSNTVSIFDYGRTPDGIFYYAMEYLEGLNLQELVGLDGPQPPSRVVHIMRQVASSLSEAHGIGLIHRDIKPGNVIVVAERGGSPDVAKVVDFGLVKELDNKADLTRDNQVAGTPHYLAPEVISSPEDVGPRADLYSLGCVGYYLLTGHTVFEGRTVVEVCSHHLHTQPVTPEERVGCPLPRTLSQLVMSCLEKRPDQRPQSAEILVAMLDACDDVEPWTHQMGRAWWKSQGCTALTERRQQTASGDRRSHLAVSTRGISPLETFSPARKRAV
jgi:eukaryotic-like serine/threonine-protein kinase